MKKQKKNCQMILQVLVQAYNREGQLKGKSSQCGFHFTTPLLTREREE
jgi:hypothetical protein